MTYVHKLSDTLNLPARQQSQCDFADIIGQHEAIEALTIAAAGGHNLAMVGPPGAGKTMLAERLPTILPKLTEELALEATSIASLHSEEITELRAEPPFEAPHHTASAAAIIGGGTNRVIHVGAITRANNGVLFLDEAPEFSSRVLEALRQPLESGTVEIHRTQLHTALPARFQLILAANPCPCGNEGNTAAAQTCTCTPYQRIRYSGKISGPLKDRIDMHLQLQRVSHPNHHAAAATTTVSSAELRTRVIAARERARSRLKDTPWETNTQVSHRWVQQHAPHPKETSVIDQALARGALTLRGYTRIIKVAWTIADLHEADRPQREHIAQALQLRNGEQQ